MEIKQELVNEETTDCFPENAFKSCCLCGEGLRLLNLVREHFQTHHKLDDSFGSRQICACQHGVDLQTNLMNHLILHVVSKGEDPVGIEECEVKVELIDCDSFSNIPEIPHFQNTNSRLSKPVGAAAESECSSSSSSQSQDALRRKLRKLRSNFSNDFIFDIATNKFRCVHCHVECQTKSNIKKHLHRIHQNLSSTRANSGEVRLPKILKCTECPNAIFHTLLSLNEHMLTHYPQKIRASSLTCHKCFKTYETSKKLYFHLITHNEALLECDDCGKKFKFKASLKKHLYVHVKRRKGFDADLEMKRSRTTQKRVMCDQCSQMVLNPKRHNFIHHSNEKPFKCDFPNCNSSFKESRSLNEHKNLHTGEKPYICEYCSQAFAHTAMLRMHRQRHINPEKFKCSTCGECFVNGQSLRQHETRQHPSNQFLSDARPYACDFEGCTSTFNYEKLLKRHKKTVHFKIKVEMKCELCKFMTDTRKNYNQHMIRAHNVRKREHNRVFPVKNNLP